MIAFFSFLSLLHSPWFGYNMFVKKLNSSLKASKLHHGVRDLPHPQGREALVEPETKQKNLVKDEILNMSQVWTKKISH